MTAHDQKVISFIKEIEANLNYEVLKSMFIKKIEYLSGKYQRWEIFSAVVRIGALYINQKFNYKEELEKEFIETSKKFDYETRTYFIPLLLLVQKALSLKFSDFLGECFMSLELGNKYKGQFFTPYSISFMMASILGDYSGKEENLSEPACGAGGMIIARAEALEQKGINYLEAMQVQAVDVDFLAYNMCYIQLSLLGISAEVVHGNTLSLETFEVMYTPAYIIKKCYRAEEEKLNAQVQKFKNILMQLEGKEQEQQKEIKKPYPNFILLGDDIENKQIKTKEEVYQYSEEQLKTFESGSLF